MTKRLLKNALVSAFLAVNLLGCPASAQKHESTDRQKVAMAMFQERCKKAGEFIHKTIEGVDGVFLLKLRPPGINYGNQYALNDPYGHDLLGNGYVGSFLRGSYEAGRGQVIPIEKSSRGYDYVEAVDSKDGVRYRYTGRFKEVTHVQSVMSGGDGKSSFKSTDFVVERTEATGPHPRYGVTYDDISTREERDYWIAGSSLKVMDTQTGEILAERIGYMVDVFQGSRVGARSPWLFAADHACPAFPGGSAGQSRQADKFVEKVLIPKIR
jgi:hypothetical protein